MKTGRMTTFDLRIALSLLMAAGISLFLLLASQARANTPIVSFTALPSTTQAGGHPDVEVSFRIANRLLQHSESACNCEDAKDIIAHLPTGSTGNPHAVPQCTIAEFSSNTCAVDSQVGIAGVVVRNGGPIPFDAAIYNLVPPPEEAGLLGFKLLFVGQPLFIVLSGRTGSDYGLDAGSKSIFHGFPPLESLQQVLWGVPADPSHNLLRLDTKTLDEPVYLGRLCNAKGEVSTADPRTVVQPCQTNFETFPPVGTSNSSLTPFLQNPTNCDSTLPASLDVLSYDGGTDHADATWPQMTGCDQLSFNPSLYAQPTTTQTDSASGIDVDLEVPQPQSSTVPSPSELRGSTVTLPEGFSINPNAADGKTSCSDAEARFGTEEESRCPEFAKVGSLTIDSSALPGPLPGFVYLGDPQPGNRYRIFLVANGFATHIKLSGTVIPNPVTGQLKVIFENLPQTPLTAFNMHFFGSERGLLATPTQCGTYPVTSTFTPWDTSLSTQTSTQFFTIDSGPSGSPCPPATRAFNPGFRASSLGHTGGTHAPFWVELTRSDGDQNLSGVSITTPPGFSATIKGVPYCSDVALGLATSSTYTGLQEQAAPSCPVASQIGTAITGAGAGNHPLYVPGKVYLSGPYKGAPLSLAVITPAISGPYDLGDVVVRAALHLDPTTAQITATSDPLPQILEGIPLRLRSIRINLDRPDFALNPTNCDPFSVTSQITGSQRTVASRSTDFQVADCALLPFTPKLALKFSGSTKRAGNPALHAVLTYPKGGPYANIARTEVTLPPTEGIDNAHIQNPCTRVQFAANACPPSSVIGSAKAETPLLAQPLAGPVYLMTGFGHKLPDLVADLKGQFNIVLDGHIDSIHRRIRTTFETVPDAPVSKFTLDLNGDKKGLIENNTNLCASTHRLNVNLVGQNGKMVEENPTLATGCAKKKTPKAKKKVGTHRNREDGRR